MAAASRTSSRPYAGSWARPPPSACAAERWTTSSSRAIPAVRRGLLEEAAGITGLHSRRHEAELRLKAAEANLARLDDVIVTLESQLQALKKQARQASRYRNLQDHIRRQEAILFHLLWTDAEARLKSAEESLTAAETMVVSLTSTAAVAS